MIKLKSIQLTLLLILGVFGSCNKVKETPEPDHFLQTDLINLILTADGGQTTFDVVSENKIVNEVSLKFDQPQHGAITPIIGTSSFRYKANPGFEGTDSLGYEICRTGLCKKGSIGIQVKNNPPLPCTTQYIQAPSDTFYITLKAGSKRYATTFFPGDKYCPDNLQKIQNHASDFSKVTIKDDSIILETNRIFTNNKNLIVTYSNYKTASSTTPEKTRILKIRMETSTTYCDDIFSVSNGNAINSQQDYVIISPNTHFQRVVSCYNDLDPNFFDVYTSTNLVKHKIGKNFKITKKPGSSNTGPLVVYYIYRNIRMVADTGQCLITLQ